MCGIAGLIGTRPPGDGLVAAMTATIAHRGPDSDGHWRSPDGLVAFGHRRLAIVDLSAAGQQPMTSADGRLTIVFNGEIYNHLDMRERLRGGGAEIAWRGHSDTETLVEAMARWGIGPTIAAAHGMLALAVHDAATGHVTFARDRFGEKPLYLGRLGTMLAFASELKAVMALPDVDPQIDPAALRHLLGRGFVATDHSILAGFAQVEPGTIVTIDPATLDRVGQPERYYDYPAVVAAAARKPFATIDDAVAATGVALEEAVARMLMADVPVGTLLSGGIDSSLVTALAVRATGAPVRSFSIGFEEAGFDEAPHARAVARHLGTQHHELYVGDGDARDLIPRLPAMFDEPFADSSQLPTFIVSRFARSEVTVALTGDGGDELFGGYERHIRFPALWRRLGQVPAPVRAAGLAAGAAVPAAAWNRAAAIVGRPRPPFFGHKVRRTLTIARGQRDFDRFYGAFLDEWSGCDDPLARPVAMPGGRASSPALDDLARRAMVADALDYLPGDILTKVDRAGMAVSLEARIPFLDPGVADVAARIPTAMNIAGGKGKAVLRALLHRHVPAAIVDRPKAGFAIPVGQWLRGPLRPWAEDLLSTASIQRDGLLNATPIRARWAAHVAGAEDATQAIWAVLMFVAWRRHWLER